MPSALIPSSARHLPLAVSSKGARIFDEDGNDYIDGSSGPLAMSLGHGHPTMLKALADQAGQLTYAHRAQFRNQPAEQLAQVVAERLGEPFGRSMFVSGGSEAIELAMKTAHMYWAASGRPEKSRFVSTSVSYHGNTLGAMNLSGQPRYSAAFKPLVHAEQTITAPQTFRLDVPDGTSAPEVARRRLREEFLALDLEHTAAVVVEGVGGSSTGVLVPPPGFFAELRRLCDEHDVLWICDEVMSGFGRTGTWFAFQHSPVTPDIVCFAKGVAGGYAPLGGITTTHRVWDRVAHRYTAMPAGHTFTNFPVSCAAGLAAIGVIEDEDLLARVTSRGRLLGEELRALAHGNDLIGDVRGLGFMWGVELVADAATGEPFDPAADVTSATVSAAAARGLIVYPARFCAGHGVGDAVVIAPPLTATDAEIHDLLDRLRLTLLDVRSTFTPTPARTAR